MDPRIEFGRLDERPHGTGVAREAHGEFVGPNGEMASYAIGWTTGAEPAEARLTVGIGAGNVGGGTFHARVFDKDGDQAYSLIDEPFAEVPEGGPHLTAAQARAHEDLAFVWWVADVVMARDPRALWMSAWLLGTPAIATRQVAEGSEPVLLVVHDDDEIGGWQLIGRSDAASDGRILHLGDAVERDPTITEVLDLRPGRRATRPGPGGAWTRD